MSGSVNNIYFNFPVKDRCIFCKDGNTFFPFQIIAVENGALRHGSLIVPESMRLFEHAIHKRRFAMIHVRDNRDISDIVIHRSLGFVNGVIGQVTFSAGLPTHGHYEYHSIPGMSLIGNEDYRLIYTISMAVCCMYNPYANGHIIVSGVCRALGYILVRGQRAR